MPAVLSLIERVDALLPQTQCTKCGYDGCRPYATAIIEDGEAINRCPPGGVAGIRALAALLNRPEQPLDTDCGEHRPLHTAVIDEAHCIGCTLCIQACPVDAIVGANKLMHTVVPDLCTGCDLCVAPCPVDCIEMRPASREWTPAQADQARSRHESRARRMRRLHDETLAAASRTLANKAVVSSVASDENYKKQTLANVLARVRERRKNQSS